MSILLWTLVGAATWRGTAFDPQLAGYFGPDDLARCIDTVIRIMGENVVHVRGIKMSLLDADQATRGLGATRPARRRAA